MRTISIGLFTKFYLRDDTVNIILSKLAKMCIGLCKLTVFSHTIKYNKSSSLTMLMKML